MESRPSIRTTLFNRLTELEHASPSAYNRKRLEGLRFAASVLVKREESAARSKRFRML